jgi:predicted metal-binding protein
LRARGAKIQVVRVDCLSRCQRPCNARLAGRGKPGLELTLMRIEHADELVRLALAYSESKAGAAIEDLPSGLRSQ